MSFVVRCWREDRRLGCGVVAALAYLLVARLTFGTRPEQVVVCGLLVVAAAWSAGTRRFARGMMPFLLMGMVYDCLRLLNPLVSKLSVWVAGPYQLEKALFGLGSGAQRITFNELFA